MKIAVVGVLFLSLVAGPVALADAGGPPESNRGDDHRDSSRDHRDGRDDHNDRNDNHGRYGDYHQPKGYREHRWQRGERLPKAYYSPDYVVVNYRERGWRQPPRGYHWVRVNNDVVLAAVGTGIVLDVLLNQF